MTNFVNPAPISAPGGDIGVFWWVSGMGLVCRNHVFFLKLVVLPSSGLSSRFASLWRGVKSHAQTRRVVFLLLHRVGLGWYLKH
jgi:hypothetical protein